MNNQMKKIVFTAMPIMIQSVISNLAGLVDNVMVGSLGTSSLSGVAICNQLLFVYYMSLGGLISGAGIFTTQFYGKSDQEGVRNTLRCKLIFAAVTTSLAILLLAVADDFMIGIFIQNKNQDLQAGETLIFAKEYLFLMLFGLAPYAISQSYSSSLRETGEVKAPMFISILSVLVNICLNYVLIYGNFGMPKMGVAGAALGTVFSRVIECFALILVSYISRKKHPFVKGAFKLWKVPFPLLRQTIIKGVPGFGASFLWSLGVTSMIQSYSTRGLTAVAAYNIASTVNGVFANVFGSLGVTLMILVGQQLGAGRIEEAKKIRKQATVIAVLVSACIGVVMAALSGVIPQVYNTSPDVKSTAAKVMLIMASVLPICAYTNCSGGTLRAGGKSMLSFFFEGGFIIVIFVPCAYLLSRFTNLSFIPLYFIVQYLELLRAIVLHFVVKRGSWARQLI